MPMAVAAALREVEIGPGDVSGAERSICGRDASADVTLVMACLRRG